jgi:hypothetical protein
MILRVRYQNGIYDHVSSQSIDRLINRHRIKMFYRPSERRWVDTGRDTVRKEASGRYDGIERRSSSLARLWLLIDFEQHPTRN